jgi:hypothetical protein
MVKVDTLFPSCVSPDLYGNFILHSDVSDQLPHWTIVLAFRRSWTTKVSSYHARLAFPRFTDPSKRALLKRDVSLKRQWCCQRRQQPLSLARLPSEMAHGHAHTALHARFATAIKGYCFS